MFTHYNIIVLHTQSTSHVSASGFAHILHLQYAIPLRDSNFSLQLIFVVLSMLQDPFWPPPARVEKWLCVRWPGCRAPADVPAIRSTTGSATGSEQRAQLNTNIEIINSFQNESKISQKHYKLQFNKYSKIYHQKMSLKKTLPTSVV